MRTNLELKILDGFTLARQRQGALAFHRRVREAVQSGQGVEITTGYHPNIPARIRLDERARWISAVVSTGLVVVTPHVATQDGPSYTLAYRLDRTDPRMLRQHLDYIRGTQPTFFPFFVGHGFSDRQLADANGVLSEQLQGAGFQYSWLEVDKPQLQDNRGHTVSVLGCPGTSLVAIGATQDVTAVFVTPQELDLTYVLMSDRDRASIQPQDESTAPPKSTDIPDEQLLRQPPVQFVYALCHSAKNTIAPLSQFGTAFATGRVISAKEPVLPGDDTGASAPRVLIERCEKILEYAAALELICTIDISRSRFNFEASPLFMLMAVSDRHTVESILPLINDPTRKRLQELLQVFYDRALKPLLRPTQKILSSLKNENPSIAPADFAKFKDAYAEMQRQCAAICMGMARTDQPAEAALTAEYRERYVRLVSD